MSLGSDLFFLCLLSFTSVQILLFPHGVWCVYRWLRDSRGPSNISFLQAPCLSMSYIIKKFMFFCSIYMFFVYIVCTPFIRTYENNILTQGLYTRKGLNIRYKCRSCLKE